MPAPASADELIELVRKSGVLEEARLNTFVEKMRAAGGLPAESKQLADLMVREGLLTFFQCEQLMLGKWRRFHIGKYKVLERLGAGGMGSVYLCEHKFMRRRAAVKVLPAAKADDPSALERFYREARAVAALDHPNIVRAYDIDQDDKLHFLVMEYVDGANLQEIVKKTGPMDPVRAAHYMYQSAHGLQHAHETAALVHRDIKPGNILVDRGGTVKVLDMGLARFFHDEIDQITQKYDENVLGTADYLAPEQALDSHKVDIRADIYSLGATFYYCLTGRSPFSEGTVAQKLIWHQTRQPKPIKSFRTDVPDGLLAILDKMMAKQPEDRYQTPGELVEALEPFTRTPIPPPPEEEMPKLSPAAMGLGAGEGGSSPRLPGPPGAPSSKRQKNWNVPASSRPTPPSPRPAPSARPAPTPEPRVGGGAPVKPTAQSRAPAATAEPVRDEESVHWERVGTETEDPSAQIDTDPTSAPPKPASTPKVTARPARKRVSIANYLQAGPQLWGLLATLAAAVLFVVLVWCLWIAWR
jgi:eukaryotic-like serine/threonine-protein kinase